MLDQGEDLGMPNGVLINGKGPYRYNTTLVPDGIEYETINVEPGKKFMRIPRQIHFCFCGNFLLFLSYIL